MQYVLRFKLQAWMSRHQKQVPEHERTYLRRAINQNPDKLARFRMSLKAHKIPQKMMCPIVLFNDVLVLLNECMEQKA